LLNLKNSLLVGASVSAFAVFAVPALAQSSADSNETVIVTGTRVQGMTAADSAAPITVLGSDALTKGNGSTDLRQALGQTVPSFVAQQFGSDTANLTLSAALRGLSPNDTLVLVNGKRRHYSGNLHVDAGGFAAGSSAADLSFIPEAAIDHVEVLLDGAAAQYGTDAISGVVNIVLKKKSSGGSLSATFGDYYSGGGNATGKGAGTYDVSYNMGLPLFDKGFANITVEKSFTNFTQYGGADNRYLNAQGQPVGQNTVTGVGANGVATLSGAGNGIPNSLLPGVPGYPRTNGINGSPQSQLTLAELNAGYDINDSVQIYAFGTIGHKFAKSNENDRLANQVIATMGSNQPCSATNPNGYATGSSTQIDNTGVGTTAACTGQYTLAGSVGAPGTDGAGLNAKGQIISAGNAGNLFSSNLIDARTGKPLPVATGAGTLGTEPELVFAPNGFRPMEVLKEDDYQYNMGVKFNVLGWDTDADISYGKDIDSIYTWNSANRVLFVDTHTSPTNFYDGSFTASQFVGSIDASHGYNIGMASPLTVAVGAEAREDTYGIGAGDPASTYKDGPQGFPGFAQSTAGTHSRKNYAGYIDLALAPIEALQLDVAGRFEHYTDFGDAKIGKITARYDFNDKLAIRGTLATGFRAPTLAEEFYTAVNVSPTVATVQLPANGPAAALLGLGNLKPETSVSYSVGLVAHPIDDLSVTVDAYSTAIGNRITSSATISASGGAINVPAVTGAIAADNVFLDPTAGQQGVTAFLNGLSTLTQGVDVTVNYPTDFGAYGLVDWTVAGNYNETAISRVAPVPTQITNSAPNASFFRPDTLAGFEHSAPAEKVGLTANWTLDQFGATFRETYYGPQHGTTSPNNGGQVIPFNQAGVGITDGEVRYNITEQVQFAIGANNLFDIRPDVQPYAQDGVLVRNTAGVPTTTALNGNNTISGVAIPGGNGNVNGNYFGAAFNPNGGYYYGRITFNF
jgi:outer membrane receptor protein involved in Fe transport